VLGSKTKKLFKMSSLKGIFWNSNGFGDIAKHLFVKEILREEKSPYWIQGDLISHYLF
jgi:hypothetical protein